jgi:hypothetical protein
LPTIQGSPITTAWRAPLQVLQRENRLPDLAPERRLIAAKPFENSAVEVGQTKKAAGGAIRTREWGIFSVERDGADGAFDGVLEAFVDEAHTRSLLM